MGMSDFQIEAALAEKKRLADLIEADKMRYFGGGDYRNEDARLAQPQSQSTLSDLFAQQDPSIYDSNRSLSVSYVDPNKPAPQAPIPLGQGNWDNRVVDNQTGRVQHLQSVPEVQGVNRSVNQVEVPGYGKGYYLKGDSTRAVLANGQIVDLGRDTGAERTRTKENLAMDAQRANIAHTNAETDKANRSQLNPNGIKLKQGERFKKDGSGEAEVIPGSDLDKKQKGVVQSAKEQVSLHNQGVDSLIKNINELIGDDSTDNQVDHPGLAGSVGAIDARIMPFTQNQATAQSFIRSLKDKSAVSGLQSIRQSGTAPGSITEKEWPIFQNLINNLDPAQDLPSFKRQLSELRDTARESKARATDNFNQRFQPTQSVAPAQESVPTARNAAGMVIYLRNGKWSPQ